MLKALVAEPDDVHGADTVVDHDQALFRVKFLVGAGGHFAHGNQQAAVNVGGRNLPRLAHVD